MVNPKVISYLENLTENYADPVVRSQAPKVKELYEKKLWHQLTGVLSSIVQLPHFHSGKAFERKDVVEFYNNVIQDFEDKINSFELAKMILVIAHPFNSPQDKADFLQGFTKRLGSDEREAYAYIKAEYGFIQLQLQKIDIAKEVIDELQQILNGVTGFNNLVYTNYYRLLAQYFKFKVNSTEYYKNTLLYLVYTPLEHIPVKEQHLMAFDLGIAALISKEIYNFGELLTHPIASSLSKNPDLGWIAELLSAVNSGNLDEYNKIKEKFKTKIENTHAIKNTMPHINEKIAIMALVELIFSKPSDQRIISFEELAKGTHLVSEQVELLVMKALSLGLIKGSIDEVDQTINIHWVQPRVLDMTQIGKMRDRLGKWKENVGQLLTFIQNETAPELLN